MLKRLLNLPEEVTHKKLSQVCERYGALIYIKIRLADVFEIRNSGISSSLYSFSLKSHFDFIVAKNNHQPLFAVEFDGPHHKSKKQRIRDDKKNTLCERFEVPLLRINSLYLLRKYRNLDLLSWFVELWFVLSNIDELQEIGEIPQDEIVDQYNIAYISGHSKPYPFYLSAEIRIKLKELYDSNKIFHYVPFCYIGEDERGNYRGIAYLRITEDAGLIAKTGMRKQGFPIRIVDAVQEILTFELYDRLLEYFDNKLSLVPNVKIYAEAIELSLPPLSRQNLI